jgi:xanthine/CO dehydrogenase XdhC/CoxF family maturation factor
MDLYSDWYKPEEIQQSLGRQVQVLKQAVNWPHRTVPGIAMIIDDDAVLETNGGGNFENEAIMWEQKMGLARCGVPYRIYLLDDLRLPSFPKHRVYYFPNLYRVDDERLALLREKVFRDGNVVIWGPGSGISDGQEISAESATRLTGFSFKYWPVNYTRKTLISNFEHPLTRGLPADTVISGAPSYGPLLFPTDGTELGLAWTKNGDTIPGLAVKEMGTGPGRYHSVFTSAVPLPAGLWRNAARWAGAHVYSDSGDVLMADSTIVALHSLQSGDKAIALPGEYTVWDVVTGGLVGRRLREIHFRMEAPETRVFRLETIAGD